MLFIYQQHICTHRFHKDMKEWNKPLQIWDQVFSVERWQLLDLVSCFLEAKWLYFKNLRFLLRQQLFSHFLIQWCFLEQLCISLDQNRKNQMKIKVTQIKYNQLSRQKCNALSREVLSLINFLRIVYKNLMKNGMSQEHQFQWIKHQSWKLF